MGRSLKTDNILIVMSISQTHQVAKRDNKQVMIKGYSIKTRQIFLTCIFISSKQLKRTNVMCFQNRNI